MSGISRLGINLDSASISLFPLRCERPFFEVVALIVGASFARFSLVICYS